MSGFIFRKAAVLPKEEREAIVEKRRVETIEYKVKEIKGEIKYFKRRGLSFVIDDFHRPDGKIVERTVPTSLETYTDKINEEEYETGNVEDLGYVDKFKIKFLFPVQAIMKFNNVVPMSIDEIDNWKNPTIFPVTEEELENEIKNLRKKSEKPKIIHLSDIKDNSKLNVEFLERTSSINMPGLFYLEEDQNLVNKIIEKLMNTSDLETVEKH